MRLRYVVEDEPLGTAGPLRLALDEGVLAERVLVLNGDCLTDIDLTARDRPARGHRRGRHARARRGGGHVVATASCPRARTVRSRRSSRSAPGPRPRTGSTPARTCSSARWWTMVPPGRAVSIEREVFPELVANGLYGYLSDGYWIDIGTPERYLEATYDLLAGPRGRASCRARDETGSLDLRRLHHLAARGSGRCPCSGRHCSVGDRLDGRALGAARQRAGRAATARSSSRCSPRARGWRTARAIGPDAIVGGGAVVEAGAVVAPGARIAPGEHVS